MSKETLNTGMEKVFFHYILENPNQFSNVEPYFFRNENIQFIYTILRDNYLNSKKKIVPTPQQIFAMTKLHDPNGKISDNLIKMLLKGDNSQYENDWLDPRFKAWKISNLVKNNVMKSIDFVRGIDDVNYDNVVEVASKINQMFNEVQLIDTDEDDLGDDFDDPESHKQDFNKHKISTGWNCLDNMMNGGWDYASLIVLLGETNVGKSMWLNNIAVNIANQGKNVVFVTLEMASHKCMKRMGSMRLKIPVDSYDEKSKDSIFMKNKINQLKSSNGGVFNSTSGKIYVKKFPTGACTVTDLDNYITKLEQVKKIKIDAVLVDYINIMGIEKGLDFANMLFLKGKHLAEGLRYLADKHNVALITATQTNKSVWGASDISLRDIPESKAVAETADAVWAIIRNSEMKRQNKYRLKVLKLRDGEYKDEQIRYDFNTTFLSMENDEFVGTT